jgi:hypothetical protein
VVEKKKSGMLLFFWIRRPIDYLINRHYRNLDPVQECTSNMTLILMLKKLHMKKKRSLLQY